MNISMWSNRPSSMTTSPPAMPAATISVPATTRSGMTVWLPGSSASTPVISRLDVPAPRTDAPMAFR